MANPASAAGNTSTYYVTLYSSGKTHQVNGVINITIVSLGLSHGSRRDLPPPSPVQHEMNPDASIVGETDDAVIERDDYTHEPLRLLHEANALLWFTTNGGAAPAKPTGTFPLALPVTNYAAVDCDCFFPFKDVAACTNAPPAGFTPSASR